MPWAAKPKADTALSAGHMNDLIRRRQGAQHLQDSYSSYRRDTKFHSDWGLAREPPNALLWRRSAKCGLDHLGRESSGVGSNPAAQATEVVVDGFLKG